jgi:shikimate dehydrogenase
MWIKIGLIGEGIANSISPFLHEEEARENQIDYSYRLIDTQAPFFAKMPINKLIEYAIDKQFVGLNITYPFKQQVVPYLDSSDKQVAELNSANTILIQDGKLSGYNTDYFGYAEFLKQQFTAEKLDTILLVGAGGAGRSVALALIDHGVRELVLNDISHPAAEELAELISVLRPRQKISVHTKQNIPKMDVTGVINATPMGMSKFPGLCVDPTDFPASCWMNDIVYFPLKTLFLKKAEESGHHIFDGSTMAVFQAAHSFYHFTGLAADKSRMMNNFEKRTKHSISRIY